MMAKTCIEGCTFEIAFGGFGGSMLLDFAPNSSIPTSISLTFFRFFLWQNSGYIGVAKDLKVQIRVARYERDMKGSCLFHTRCTCFETLVQAHGFIKVASPMPVALAGKKKTVTSDPTTRPQGSKKFRARSAVERRRTALQWKHQTPGSPGLLVIKTEHAHKF